MAGPRAWWRAGLVAGVALAGSAWWAVRSRRRGRTAAATGRAARPGSRQTRRRSPVALLVPLAITVAGFGVLTGVAVVAHGKGAYSARVQDQGVPGSGVVQQVHNIQRPKSAWSAEITVALTRPGSDAATTVVHFPGKSSLRPGAAVSVLLDPANPGYAEFPGRPATGRDDWIGLAVLAGMIGVLAVALVGCVVVAFRRSGRAKEPLAPVP